jgi:hypothetical protein
MVVIKGQWIIETLEETMGLLKKEIILYKGLIGHGTVLKSCEWLIISYVINVVGEMFLRFCIFESKGLKKITLNSIN